MSAPRRKKRRSIGLIVLGIVLAVVSVVGVIYSIQLWMDRADGPRGDIAAPAVDEQNPDAAEQAEVALTDFLAEAGNDPDSQLLGAVRHYCYYTDRNDFAFAASKKVYDQFWYDSPNWPQSFADAAADPALCNDDLPPEEVVENTQEMPADSSEPADVAALNDLDNFLASGGYEPQAVVELWCADGSTYHMQSEDVFNVFASTYAQLWYEESGLPGDFRRAVNYLCN